MNQANKDHDDVLLRTRNVRKWFPIKKWFFEKKEYIKAVDDISFDLQRGKTLGIVGESACGKTTLARTILRLVEATEGTIDFQGNQITEINKKQLRSLRKKMQIVFQDPYSSLHPRMKVGKIIEEPLIISGLIKDKKARQERVKELIMLVGLSKTHLDRYPHEFSGGQRQRIVIARALATHPELIVFDEPVSALDVSVRAQILNLIKELQEQLGLTYIFISHDLSVVEHICDQVAIMYLGQMVEFGHVESIFTNPLHPYTQALLSAVPRVGVFTNKDRILLKGDVPSPTNPPVGCRFNTRCSLAKEICKTVPEFRDTGDGHFVACHLVDIP